MSTATGVAKEMLRLCNEEGAGETRAYIPIEVGGNVFYAGVDVLQGTDRDGRPCLVLAPQRIDDLDSVRDSVTVRSRSSAPSGENPWVE